MKTHSAEGARIVGKFSRLVTRSRSFATIMSVGTAAVIPTVWSATTFRSPRRSQGSPTHGMR
jgi:hypothetical protein